ncbi:tyrosine-type recombinase/integrase [Nocardioides pinisoli]|uniref:Site-specific integrase n=1 Tax=Nocardioides pinisoli TaxID=2950279 RepID=A0ABT1KYY1_9ACTN|nr:site-specific integrase [Nocardioides pinisoli]MCP3422973.1 site-specific integrase [Nocardioides pinisoli]
MARRKTGPRAWIRESYRTKNLPSSKRRWEVLYEDPHQAFKKRTKGGFRTKGDAERWRDEESPAAKHSQRLAWVDPARGDATFQTVAEEWLGTYTSASGKKAGYSQHAQVVLGSRSLVRTHWGHRRIGDITHREVTAWLKETTATRSPSTARKNFYTFRRVIRYAVQNGLILRDPTVGVAVPGQRDLSTQQAERVIPTVEQVHLLIANTPEPWGIYVRLAAATGMRPEELCALQLRDVSAACDQILVRRVLVKDRTTGESIYEDVPKTRRSRRTIDLDDFTADALRVHLTTQQARAARWFAAHPDRLPADPSLLPVVPGVGEFKRGAKQRKTGTDVDWLVFNRPLRHGWFTMRYWSSLRTSASLPTSVRFYDLRHFHASWLVEQIGRPGALSIVEIAERLGHASTKMTLDRYSHSQPDRDKRNATAAMWAAPNVTRLPVSAS